MNILGIVSNTHDTGLALLKDGHPELILEEERFRRVKHTKSFPVQSLKYAFGDGMHDFSDVDAITVPWNTTQLVKTFFSAISGRLPASLNLLRPAAHSTQDSAIVNLWLRTQLQIRYHLGETKLPPIYQVPHHDAHAAVFFVSPFEDANVLVMDGYGDVTATSGYVGNGKGLEQKWRLGFFDSLGMLYTCVTTHLGFKPFEEGTVMALAACGGPTYVEKFRPLVHMREGGRFSINRDFVSYDTHGLIRPFTQHFVDVFGPPRQRDEPITDRHRDLAYALQMITEETVLNLVRSTQGKSRSKNLVITGGVGLNCVSNARILRDTSYERVWVPPCASDTGAPFGSALWHYHQTLKKPRVMEMTHPFYGRAYSDAEIVAALDKMRFKYERMDEKPLLKRVAQDLADQKIVGWFQGRFEIGPRALGNRSILADPRSLKIKDLINARIKFREPFRPFAPAVLLECAHEYFEIEQPDPFMTLAPRVRPDKVSVIPAAVHVDGTGRIQTVRREDNPRYYGIIEAFGELTGVPVLINTSFNRHEPIVASPADAISCYLRTDMDVLVLGDYYITDRSPEQEKRAQRRFDVLQGRLKRYL